mgnify:CR=1 FL=1|jgi:hypothetical protein
MPCDKTKMLKESDSITPETFVKMTKTEQVCLALKLGKELMSRSESGFSISLYLISGFFVEIWYRSPDRQIDQISLITNKQLMKKYEKEIDLDEML